MKSNPSTLNTRRKSNRRVLSIESMEDRIVLSTVPGLSVGATALHPPVLSAAAPSINTKVERVLNAVIGAARPDLENQLRQALEKQSYHEENIRKITIPFAGKKKTGYEVDFNARLNELGRVTVSNVQVNPSFLSIKFDLFAELSVRANGRAKVYALDIKTLDVSASGRQYVEGRFKVEALISGGKFFVRVNSSDVQLKRLDLDSVGKLGGEGARLLGNAITGAIRQWKPEIIRNAQTSMNNTIVAKAALSADLKELVRTRK